MPRRVCLTIGAAKAKPLDYLPGAANAARDVGLWAKAAGFDSVTVLTDDARVPGWRWDKSKPEAEQISADGVTVQAIAREITALLPGDDETDLFLLHFAGHGLRQGGARTLWMPTDWDSALRAVAVETLKHRLEHFGIRNLTIVSDACRSYIDSAKLDNLTPDGVLGSGITARSEVALDRFNATYDGDEAYMIKGQSPDDARCILSGVLVDALWGDEPEAIDQYIADKITTGSLSEFLPRGTQQVGERYSLASKAEVFPGLPRDHVVYLDLASKPLPPPGRSSWPAATVAVIPPLKPEDDWHEPTDSERHFRYNRVFYPSEYRDAFGTRTRYVPVETVKQYPGRPGKKEQAVRIGSALSLDRARDEKGNLHISGEPATRIWSRSAPSRTGASAWKVDVPDGTAQAIVEYQDGLFVPVVIYRDLDTIVSRDKPDSVGWGHGSRRAAPPTQEALDIVARMQTGLIAPAHVGEVAATIRRQKHGNPMLGAIAAYLYDYIGDRDNIRRMAWYYKKHQQPVPYDIALMGVMNSHKKADRSFSVDIPAVPKRKNDADLPRYTSSETGAVDDYPVAGFCPWLRQGWDFVAAPEDSERALADGLARFLPHLQRSNFTSLDRAGGEGMIKLWRLKGGNG